MCLRLIRVSKVFWDIYIYFYVYRLKVNLLFNILYIDKIKLKFFGCIFVVSYKFMGWVFWKVFWKFFFLI